jgi:hypothetical protein
MDWNKIDDELDSVLVAIDAADESMKKLAQATKEEIDIVYHAHSEAIRSLRTIIKETRDRK